MKKLFQISLLFLFVSSAFAQQSSAPKEKVLRVYDWKDLNIQSTNCQIVSMDGMSVLKIENTNNAPLEVSLLKITNSSVIKNANTVSCEMKYKDVSDESTTPAGNLTLLRNIPPSAFGGDEHTNKNWFDFFGTSNWKRYDFGINLGETEGLPTQLEFKFFLPKNGTVYLRPIKLMGTVDSFNWWSPQQAGLIGGIGGSIIGCFGGLIGLLAGKGKARNFVLGAVKFSITLGILLIIAGLVAMSLKQPYAVWYALLLPGVILVLVFSLNLHSIQRRYDELEIRRMTSIDTMGS
jgi:hypothetical protein